MAEFITFFIIIFAGLLFSEFFNRLHLPWVTALIVSGIVFGAPGLGFIAGNDVTDFFSEVGLVFLMFMAGLEIKFSTFSRVLKEVSIVSLINGAAPLLAAVGIAALFGLTQTAGLLLAAALISSSIAVVYPSLQGRDILRRNSGHTIIASTIVLDIVSVTLFSFLIRQSSGAELPLLATYVFLAIALLMLRVAVPKLSDYFARRKQQKYEQELQLVISILVGTVVLFGLLGLQPAEAGFFAGLVLSDSINSTVTRAKLHAIGYGIFIPVFFVMVGAEMSFAAFSNNPATMWLTLAVVVGSMGSKFISGWVAGRLVRFNNSESLLLGIATTPQLNVSLAIAATGFAYGLIPQELLTALIVLTVATTLVAPPIIARLAERAEASEPTRMHI